MFGAAKCPLRVLRTVVLKFINLKPWLFVACTFSFFVFLFLGGNFQKANSCNAVKQTHAFYQAKDCSW